MVIYRVFLAAVLVALPVVSCDSSSSNDDSGSASASPRPGLLARASAALTSQDIPSSLDEIVYVDFVAAREEVGVAQDTDVYDPRQGGSSRALLLASLAGRALPYADRPTATPLKEAIDGAAIEASARVALGGPTSVLLIDTSQPFDEISAVLRRRGYVEDGELLGIDRSSSTVVYPVVANSGKGVIVLAGSERSARAALGGRDVKLTPAAELIRDVPGVARAASARRNGCLVGRAAGQSLVPQQGEYLLVIDGKADAARMTVAGKRVAGGQGDLIFGEATSEGDRVRAKFRSEDVLNVAFLDIVDDAFLASHANERELPYIC